MQVKTDAKAALKELRQIASKLPKQKVRSAIARSVNRSLMEGRTEARKAIKESYNIPQRYLDTISYSKATATKPEGKVLASAKPIPMDAFSPKYESPTASISVTKKGIQKSRDKKRKGRLFGKGVSIEVHKGKREVVPFAFMIRGARPRVFARGQYKTGSYGFIRRFKREISTGSDTPIKPLLSVTVHAAALNHATKKKVKDRVLNAFPKHLRHEIKRLASTLSK